MEPDKVGFSEEVTTVIWRNPAVRDVINKNFPGEWEKDIAFLALAVVAGLGKEYAALLGADIEETINGHD